MNFFFMLKSARGKAFLLGRVSMGVYTRRKVVDLHDFMEWLVAVWRMAINRAEGRTLYNEVPVVIGGMNLADTTI